MSLSKNYTLKKIKSLLRILTRQLGLKALIDKEIVSIINYNLFDLAALLNGAQDPFYQDKEVLGDAATFYSDSAVAGGTYTDSTKTVTKTAHGLTTADIGRRIILHSETPGTCGITTIASIVSVNAFTLTNSMGTTIGGGTFYYAVLSKHSGAYLEMSALKVNKVIKLVDSDSGEVVPAGDSDFEKLADLDEYSESLVYNQVGETLELFKGADISAWGTLTLHYYRTPNTLVSDTDYVDLKDSYIGLLLDKCKLVLYEMAKIAAPKDLSDSVLLKTKELIGSDANRVAGIQARAGKQ